MRGFVVFFTTADFAVVDDDDDDELLGYQSEQRVHVLIICCRVRCRMTSVYTLLLSIIFVGVLASGNCYDTIRYEMLF